MSLIKINYQQIDGTNTNSPFSEVGFDPELVVNSASKNSVYWKCPAWKHKASRTFLIRSPVTMTLGVVPPNNGEGPALTSPNLTQWQFDQYLGPTFISDWCTPERTTLQLGVPRFIFWTEQKNIWVETRPHFNTAIKNNLTSIPAWFNLSAWPRAVGFACDIIDPSKPVIIRRGDPLMEICFYSNNLDSGVLLKKKQPSEELLDDMDRKGSIKEYIRGISKNYIFKKQESKCPFSHLWKK